MRWFYRWYGANPLHLLTLIASFALAGYAAQRLLARDTVAIAIWFAGAVIGHDLLLMPLYSIADRSVLAVFRHDRKPDPPTVSWINYLRVPVVLSGLLLLIWFPLIFRLPTRFPILTGLSLDPYLSRWLAVTGVLFLLSAVALAFRLSTRAFTRAGRAGQSGRTGRHGLTSETAPPEPFWETGLEPEPGWDPRYERPAPAWDPGRGRPGPPPREPGATVRQERPGSPVAAHHQDRAGSQAVGRPDHPKCPVGGPPGRSPGIRAAAGRSPPGSRFASPSSRDRRGSQASAGPRPRRSQVAGRSRMPSGPLIAGVAEAEPVHGLQAEHSRAVERASQAGAGFRSAGGIRPNDPGRLTADRGGGAGSWPSG